MGLYKNIITLMTMSLASILILIIGLSFIKFKPSLFPRENELTQFNYERVKIIERNTVVVSGLKSPIEIPSYSEKKDFPTTSLTDVVPVTPIEELKVSFVLIRDHAKMAIISGKVVREGDVIKAGKIKKIQKDGVLIKEKEGEKWLKIK
jgi:hypothetical protein